MHHKNAASHAGSPSDKMISYFNRMNRIDLWMSKAVSRQK